MTERKQRNPDIVDNVEANMVDTLNFNVPSAESLDISSGYFELSGYRLVRSTLEPAVERAEFSLRLLLGRDAISPPVFDTFEEYRKKVEPEDADEPEDLSEIKSVKMDLDMQDLTQDNMDATASLIRLLKRDNVQVRHNNRKFNHSKCYILGRNMALVGSSNFTSSGFRGNHELNVGIYQPASLEKIDSWFGRMWERAHDSKAEMISLLEQSKFGIPPCPYRVYAKILFEKYKPTLLAMDEANTAHVANLTKFQTDAVATAMRIINSHRGVIIADSTGLGKTHICLDIIRQKMRIENKRVLLIAPSQVLETVWKSELRKGGFLIDMESTEMVSREDFQDKIRKYQKADVIVIDESQAFRSRNTGRLRNLMKLVAGKRKDTILLSATPINNSIMDLYYQISIITAGDEAYFVDIGIPDFYEYMKRMAKDGIGAGIDRMQLLLDEIMVRRTRSFIKKSYPNEKMVGKPITFPEREYAPIRYDLVSAIGDDVYAGLIETIENLAMVPYGVERYKENLPDEEKKKHTVRASLQTVLLLKRFESSTQAAKQSIDNKIRLYEYFERTLATNTVASIKDLNRIIAKWNQYAEDPENKSDQDAHFLREIERLPTIALDGYDVQAMKRDLESDLSILRNYSRGLSKILKLDKKSDAVAEMIVKDGALEKESRKVLIFTEYTDTAKHLESYMKDKFENSTVRLITGDVSKERRLEIIREFSPRANSAEDEEDMPDKQADILISTEVLSEGQNLQDCNYVINYDLPWNPMRIVQRIGRIDRLTSTYPVVHSRDCYPAKELNDLLRLVGKLLSKIGTVSDVIGLDSSLLGEGANPKDFNGVIAERIRAFAGGEAAGTAAQLEREADLMQSVSPFNEISRHVQRAGMEEMKKIPMGRRSGKEGEGSSAVLAYVQEFPKRRFYSVSFDYETGDAEVIDDIDAFRAIACKEDTPAHMPMDGDSHEESFRHLLYIDSLARKAILQRREHDTDTANRLRMSRHAHSKNVDRITGIIATATAEGKIAKEVGRSVFNTIKIPDLRAWADNVSNALEEYDKSRDVVALSDEIKKIGVMAGVEDIGDRKRTDSPEAEPKGEEKLVLVGAMFIGADPKKMVLERFLPT